MSRTAEDPSITDRPPVATREASPLARLAGRIIDLVVWGGLQALAAVGADIAVVDLARSTGPASSAGSGSTGGVDDIGALSSTVDVSDPVYVAVAAVAIVGITLYEVALVATAGATIGKRVARTRVIDQQGRRPGVRVAAMRIAPFTVLALVGVLVPAAAAWTNGTMLILAIASLLLVIIDRRTVWDRLASTAVVEWSASERDRPIDE